MLVRPIVDRTIVPCVTEPVPFPEISSWLLTIDPPNPVSTQPFPTVPLLARLKLSEKMTFAEAGAPIAREKAAAQQMVIMGFIYPPVPLAISACSYPLQNSRQPKMASPFNAVPEPADGWL